MEQRLSIITLAVADLDRSREFYSGILGWKQIESSDEKIIFYQLNGFQFALYPAEEFSKEHAGIDARKPSGFTFAYNQNSEREVDETFRFLEDNDVEITKMPEKVFWGGYSGYFTGPDGEMWEVAYNPFTAVNEDGTFGK